MLISLEENQYDEEIKKISLKTSKDIYKSWYKLFYITAFASKTKRNSELSLLSLKATSYSEDLARSYYENVDARFRGIEDGIRDYYKSNKSDISEEIILEEIYSVELPEKDLKCDFCNGKTIHFSRRLKPSDIQKYKKKEEINEKYNLSDGGLRYIRKK